MTIKKVRTNTLPANWYVFDDESNNFKSPRLVNQTTFYTENLVPHSDSGHTLENVMCLESHNEIISEKSVLA